MQESVAFADFHATSRRALRGGKEFLIGCRTQFRARVADARKILENYASGPHRVVFHGDHVRAAERTGKLMGFQVVREG